jgi:hypothetical protein
MLPSDTVFYVSKDDLEAFFTTEGLEIGSEVEFFCGSIWATVVVRAIIEREGKTLYKLTF